MEEQIRNGARVLVPEITDYEVQRELLRAGKTKGVASLNALKSQGGYLPLTTEVMLKAAELLAYARSWKGQQPGTPNSIVMSFWRRKVACCSRKVTLSLSQRPTSAISHCSLMPACGMTSPNH